MRAENLHESPELFQHSLVKIAERKVRAVPEYPSYPHRQARLNPRIEFKIDDFFRGLQVEQIFAGDSADVCRLEELNRRIPDISLRLVQMGMLFAVTRMADPKVPSRKIERSAGGVLVRYERVYRRRQVRQLASMLDASHLVHDFAQMLKLLARGVLESFGTPKDHWTTSV